MQVNNEKKPIKKHKNTYYYIERANKFKKTLSNEQFEQLTSYSEGVNEYINSRWINQIEILVSPLSIEPWSIDDTLITAQLLSYVGLVSLQSDVEMFILQSIYRGNNETIQELNQLYPNQLQNLNEEFITLIKSLKEFPKFLSADKFSSFYLNEQIGSNNWVISGDHTISGQAFQANDPHLQVDRLPSIFYEFIYKQNDKEHEDNFSSGISVPGCPGFIMGRTKYISFGFTYGFMDQIDFFLEKIENGKVQRFGENNLISIHQRKEIVQEKEIYFYETDDGCILELENQYSSVDLIPNGYYLSSKWTWTHMKAERLPNFSHFLHVQDVDSFAKIVKYAGISCNYLMADYKGNIAYQQSGLFPLRNSNYSLLLPNPAWIHKDIVWNENSMNSGDDLLFFKNPKEGFIATANHDISLFSHENSKNYHLETLSINMGPYRVQRAENLIKNQVFQNKEKITLDFMKDMQLDIYSLRAEKILPFLIPHLPSSSFSNELKNWDKMYYFDSRGALIFELLYSNIVGHMIGNLLHDSDAGLYAITNSTLKRTSYYRFDNVFVNSPTSKLFGNEGRDSVIKSIAERLLSDSTDNEFIKNDHFAYGNVLMPITYKNLFWHPLLSLFDVGPGIQDGNSVVLMCGDYRKDGSNSANSAAAWRYVTDLDSRASHTSLPGGASGNWWSTYYTNELHRYLQHKYKIIAP